MTVSLPSDSLAAIFHDLQEAARQHAANRPGDRGDRQPVHTVYGGAQLFRANTAAKIGELALRGFDQYVKNGADLVQLTGWQGDEALAAQIYSRIREKLEREAVEDFRIDFEDGFGVRDDAEEDAAAVATASEVALAMEAGSLPPFCGIRIKSLSPELRQRAMRTLDLFLTTLTSKAGAQLPPGFVVTLPKITAMAQVRALVAALGLLEAKLGLAPGQVKIEFMVETAESLMDDDGRCPLAAMVREAEGRCVAAHFGTYDFTAAMNLTAENQIMDHGICDHARTVMKIALAGTGVWLSDGATNVMPVTPHRASEAMTAPQRVENRAAIAGAWQLSFSHIRHSLRHGYYQGWDLHPMQLPVRYAALFSFFIEGLAQTSRRLKNFMDVAAKATLSGAVFDDAATGQGLLNYFLRALNCGAVSREELRETGLTLAEIQTRSFLKILEGRKPV